MSFKYENFFNTDTLKVGKPQVEKVAVDEIATPDEIKAMRAYLRSFGEEGGENSPQFFFDVYDARIMNLPVSAANERTGAGEDALMLARIALVDSLMKEADAEMIAELVALRAQGNKRLEH